MNRGRVTLGLRSYVFFAKEKAALEHMRDHIFTNPETLVWRLIAPSLGAVLGGVADEEREALWLRIIEEEGEREAQRVIDRWREAVQSSMRRSEQLEPVALRTRSKAIVECVGWSIVTTLKQRLWFDLLGVLVIADESTADKPIETVFLLGPDYGRPRQTRNRRVMGRDQPLDTVMRRGNGISKLAARLSVHPRRPWPARDANQLKYEVGFLGARARIAECGMLATPTRQPWGLLHTIIPDVERISFEAWCRMVE